MVMNEERIKNLIRNWRQKSHQEGDPFASFVFIWFCFNAWMEHKSNKYTDRGMIEEECNRAPNVASLSNSYDNVFISNDTFFKNSIAKLVGMS